MLLKISQFLDFISVLPGYGLHYQALNVEDSQCNHVDFNGLHCLDGENLFNLYHFSSIFTLKSLQMHNCNKNWCLTNTTLQTTTNREFTYVPARTSLWPVFLMQGSKDLTYSQKWAPSFWYACRQTNKHPTSCWLGDKDELTQMSCRPFPSPKRRNCNPHGDSPLAACFLRAPYKGTT